MLARRSLARSHGWLMRAPGDDNGEAAEAQPAAPCRKNDEAKPPPSTPLASTRPRRLPVLWRNLYRLWHARSCSVASSAAGSELDDGMDIYI